MFDITITIKGKVTDANMITIIGQQLELNLQHTITDLNIRTILTDKHPPEPVTEQPYPQTPE